MPGGFSGVDVFLVASGFVIGRGLFAELKAKGSIDALAFYARRARRIVPMSVLVAVVVLVFWAANASPLCFALFERPWVNDSVPRSAIASVAAVSNLWQWLLGNRYNVSDSTSPFAHYWSLGVEEQFYLVVPVLLVLMLVLLRRARLVAVVLGVLTAASFGWSIWLSGHDVVRAFYDPLSRGWEIGVGATLAAVVVLYGIHIPPLIGRLSAGAGTLAIVAFMVLAPLEAWPSWWALIPVDGTALVIVGGTGLATGWWGWPPIQRLGGWSYGRYLYLYLYLYLWHWPALLVLPLVLEREATLGERVLAEVAAAGLAAITHYLVEAPGRRIGIGTRRRQVVVLLGAAGAIAAVMGLAVGISVFVQRGLPNPVLAVLPSQIAGTPEPQPPIPPPRRGRPLPTCYPPGFVPR